MDAEPKTARRVDTVDDFMTAPPGHLVEEVMESDLFRLLDDIGNTALDMVDPGTAGGRSWNELDIEMCIRISRYADKARRAAKEALLKAGA